MPFQNGSAMKKKTIAVVGKPVYSAVISIDLKQLFKQLLSGEKRF
jgi:hypothetical protein